MGVSSFFHYQTSIFFLFEAHNLIIQKPCVFLSYYLLSYIFNALMRYKKPMNCRIFIDKLNGFDNVDHMHFYSRNYPSSCYFIATMRYETKNK